jgi:predicted small metal-binding protein
MPGCSFEARGSSEEEVLAQAAEHAKTVHNLTEIPEGMLPQVRAAIRDDEQSGAQTASA